MNLLSQAMSGSDDPIRCDQSTPAKRRVARTINHSVSEVRKLIRGGQSSVHNATVASEIF